MSPSLRQGVRTVWVFRHARSVGNEEGVFQGWSDADLSAGGRADAELLARELSSLDVSYVLSSPLLRARRTAEVLFGRVDEVDSAWVEPAAPGLQGALIRDVAAAWPELVRPDGWPHDDGRVSEALESAEAVRSRAQAGLLRAAAAPGPGDVAVVTHGSVLSALLHLAGHPSARPGNLEFLRCRVDGGSWVCERDVAV
jgi:broad specificity phosphatase PhoE